MFALRHTGDRAFPKENGPWTCNYYSMIQRGAAGLFTKAKWISCEKYETPVIRRVFHVDDWISAEMDITGLGYFEAYINGKRVTDHLFLPAQTDYHRRDTQRFNYPISDRTRYRILYLTFDVTQLLRAGENRLDILLGNGWYRQTRRTAEGDMHYDDRLKALYEIRIRSERGVSRIFSDGSERYGASPILESNLYYGELIDARRHLAFTDSVRLTDMGNVPLVPQSCPPDRVISVIAPRLIWKRNGVSLYDNGANITGFAAITAQIPQGESVVVQYAENLLPGGEGLDYRSTGCGDEQGQLQQDRFVGDGGMHTFFPRFVYHCYRYFTVTGDIQAVETRIVHTDAACISDFQSDNATLNWLYAAFRRTLLNNLHGSIPSDCPHRERLGYTGDGQLSAEAAMYCFDLSAAYRKWMEDIFDGQGENGHIQHTAPLQGGGGGPSGWGGAAIQLPYQYYRFYGDRLFLKENYPRMLRWVSYMRTRTEGGLIVREEEGGWCLGDWGTASPIATDPAFVNTAYFIYLLGLLEEMAELLGRQEDLPMLQAYTAEYKAAVMEQYFDPATGNFNENRQFANVFGLYIGLGDQRTLQNLCHDLDACTDVLDIGMLAMDFLVALLFQKDDPDRALRAIELLLGPMIQSGSTTVWEYPYRMERSNCHHMFCGMVRTLFSQLLGIRLELDGRVSVQPAKLPACMHYVRGSTFLHGKKIQVEKKR